MAGRIQQLADVVVKVYGGDVTRVWTEAGSGAGLLKRVKGLLVSRPEGTHSRGTPRQATGVPRRLGGRRGCLCGARVLPIGGRCRRPESLQKVRDVKKQAKIAAQAASAP